MQLKTAEMCYMDTKMFEQRSCELYKISTELRAEHPKAASFLYKLVTFINAKFIILSPELFKQELISLSTGESIEELYPKDQDLLEETNNKLYEIVDELDAKHRNAASILYDIVYFLYGDSRSTLGIIEQKLISLSIGENTSQYLKRFENYK